MYEKVQLRMYGDYLCSCGCGKPLGNPSVFYTEEDVAVGVRTTDDEEGWWWRLFRPSCWKRLGLDNKSLEEIYITYAQPKEVK